MNEKINEPVSFKSPSSKQIKGIAKLLNKNQNVIIFTSNEEGIVTVNSIVSYEERKRNKKETTALSVLTFGLLWMGIPRNLYRFSPIIKDSFLEYEYFYKKQSEELLKKAADKTYKILPEDMARIIPSGNC